MADRCGDSTPTGFTEASATIAISRRPVSSVKLIVLTSTVYPDTAKLQVRFQLMDATTAGTVLQTGLSLRLSATLSEDATSVASIGCALPSLTTGVGSCELDVPTAWFQADEVVSMKAQLLFRYGIEDSSTSSILSVQLANSATYVALPSTGGVLLEMPKSPRFSENELTVPVSANTGGFPLGAWSGSLKYNTTVLRFDSFTTSTGYNSAAVGLERNSTEGIVSIVVAGATSSATLADLTGDEVILGYITFTINNVPVGTYNDVAALNVDSLVTIGGYTFLESFDAYVTDARGGSVTNAQLIVLDTNEIIGSYSIVSKTEIVNTAVLDTTRAIQETEIVGYAVYRNPDNYIKNGGDEVMQSVECSITSSAVLTVETGNLKINGVDGTQNACVAKIGKTNEAGAAAASVKLTSGDGAQFVVSSIRVWFPKVVSLEAQDKVLAPVEDVYYEDCSSVYQYTNISALATYGGSGLTDQDEVDITCMVDLYLNNTEGNAFSFRDGSTTIVETNGVGKATITLINSNLAVEPSVTISAISDPIGIESLRPVLVSRAEFTSEQFDSQTPSDLNADTYADVSVNMIQKLNRKGAQGAIVVYARFKDNKVNELSHLPGLTVSTGIRYNGLSIISTAGSDNTAAPYYGEIGDVKGGMEGYDVIQAKLLTTTCNGAVGGEDIIYGYGGVEAVIADLEYVNLTASASKVTFEGDLSTNTPMNIGSVANLELTGTYSDGDIQSFTSSATSQFLIKHPTELDIYNNPTYVAEHSYARVSNDGVLTIFGSTDDTSITVMGIWTDEMKTAKVTIDIVKHMSTQTVMTPYPAFTGSSDIEKLSLNKIVCTSSYQRAILKSVATLTLSLIHI